MKFFNRKRKKKNKAIQKLRTRHLYDPSYICKRHHEMNKLARELNTSRKPKSEIWFQSLYKKHFYITSDMYNFNYKDKYIPDVINFKYKYIIEIDGSIHDIKDVYKKDLIKSEYLTSEGFTVIRVDAYNIQSYVNALALLYKLRHGKHRFNEAFMEFVEQSQINTETLFSTIREVSLDRRFIKGL